MMNTARGSTKTNAEERVRAFLGDKGALAILCGAGISRNRVPTVEEFYNDLADKLSAAFRGSVLCDAACVTEEDIRASFLEVVADLPFEHVISTLKGSELIDVRELFALFDVGEPRAYHKILADLSRRENTRLITTNLDELLESAVKPTPHKWVLGDSVAGASAAEIWKIHGTVSRPEEIAL